MLIKNILGNIHDKNINGTIINITFEWFELNKKRLKKIASDGKEFGIMTDDTLKDGDIIAVIANRIYVCDIVPSALTKIYVSSIEEMGRLCFELGNRHLLLKIEQDCVRVPYDTPTFLYLEKLGFKVFQVQEKFSDFIECKGHINMTKHNSYTFKANIPKQKVN